ncbi:amidohydrolase family protein [Rhodococcus sp. 5G237]
MPLQDYMNIISVDDHLIEHPRVWQDRLPEKFQEAGPKIIESDQGHHIWEFEGTQFPYIGLNAVAGREQKDFGVEPVRYDDMIPGCYEPKARLKDMDLDGVHASMSFPTFPGFGGGVFQRAKDKELALACVKAWNDFQLDEWCAADPDRLIPLGILPTWDVKESVKEVERLAERGTRTVSFPDAPTPLGLPSFHTDHWDPLWSALEAANMPVSLHFGSGGFTPGFDFSAKAQNATIFDNAGTDETPFAVAIALFASNHMWSLVDLLFSGALQKHPNLKVALSEGGIGWIPYILERTDFVWDRHRWYQNIDKDSRPSDLFKKHFWGCFIDDEHGLNNRHQIGIDRLMVEIDYPHSDSNWPNSRKRIAETLASVPDDEAHKIVELNARELFNWKS